MLNRFKITLLLLVAAWSSLLAKGIVLPDSGVLTPETTTITEVKRIRQVAGFSAITGSNAVPFNFVSRFATGGYIPPSDIQEYEGLLADQNRLGLFSDYHMAIYPIPELIDNDNVNALKQIEVGVQNLAGATFTKDAFGLIFRGNAPYIGTLKEAGENSFYQLSQRYLRFSFEPKSWSEGKFAKRIGLQFSQALNYNRGYTKGLSVNTDSNIDSVLISGSYYSQGTGYQFGGTGWGLQLNADFYYKLGNSKYAYLSVENFGFISLNNVSTISRGFQWDNTNLNPVGDVPTSDVNIQSVGLSGAELKVSNWFDRQRDSIESKLGMTEVSQRGNIWTPFNINIGFTSRKYDGKEKGYLIRFQYINVPGFLPRISGSYVWNPIRNLVFKPGISFGGFDVFDINTTFSLPTFRLGGGSVFVDGFINGIESFIVPNKYHGGGIGLQISYPFSS